MKRFTFFLVSSLLVSFRKIKMDSLLFLSPIFLVITSCQTSNLEPQVENVQPQNERVESVEKYDVSKSESILGIYASSWVSQGETEVQKKIIKSANTKVGQLSGQSEVGASGTWLTDLNDGNNEKSLRDGERLINAIKKYRNWKMSPGKVLEKDIKIEMKKCLDSYKIEKDKDAIVAQIFAVNKSKTLDVPINSNPLLQYLKIQKQCMEFVGSTAINCGGIYRPYGSAEITNPKDWRPGMALYDLKTPHAMIINRIEWVNNKPKTLEVIEANYASTFHNPIGQIPWERKVAKRTIPLSQSQLPANYKVVKLEK